MHKIVILIVSNIAVNIVTVTLERLEDETKEVDVRRQEHINSLTLQLKRESDQKAIVEQLQQKIAEEGERHKQMEYNLDKEKQNNRRLYEQYLKALKDLQHLHDQHKRLKAEKVHSLHMQLLLYVYNITFLAIWYSS